LASEATFSGLGEFSPGFFFISFLIFLVANAAVLIILVEAGRVAR